MAMLRKEGMVILVLTDLDDDDFEIILDNIEFRDRILFLCDRDYAGEKKAGTLNMIVDSLATPNSAITKLTAWVKRRKTHFSAVIGLDEEYRYRISEAIAKEFGLRFYQRKTLDLCSNKYLQRVALSNAGIGVPDFQLIEPDQSGRFPRPKIGFPNVLKLMTGVGSAHLYLNRSQKELGSSLEKLTAGIKADSQNPILSKYEAEGEAIDPASRFLLEEYVGGEEYSCDYLVEENRGKIRARVLRVVKKLDEKDDFGYFAGFCLYNPDSDPLSEFALNGKSGLEEFCTRIAEALNIRFGVCMLDFKFHNNRFYVIETTLRPGVATFVELMAKQYGYISLSQAIRQRLGMPAVRKVPKNTGLVAYLNAPGKGTITKIDFSKIEAHKKELGIIKLHKYCEVGESCINVAYVLAGAKNIKDAAAKLETIRKYSIIGIRKAGK